MGPIADHRLRGWRNFARADRLVLAAIALAFVVAVLLPAIAQNQTYHGFADQRQWLGVPNAADVLSSLAFVLVGTAGAIQLAGSRRRRFRSATVAGMWCIALGLVGTGMGSAFYHLDPTDASLVWDRLPMTLVFAGVLGAAIAQRAGNDAGRWVLALLVPFGLASVAYWKATGNLAPYAALQYGGIGALLALLLATRKSDDPFPWAWVVGAYVLAKIAEIGDQRIWDATHGLIAGHAVKHLLAAAAGAAALWPLHARD